MVTQISQQRQYVVFRMSLLILTAKVNGNSSGSVYSNRVQGWSSNGFKGEGGWWFLRMSIASTQSVVK